jgi:hypothetical protein
VPNYQELVRKAVEVMEEAPWIRERRLVYAETGTVNILNFSGEILTVQLVGSSRHLKGALRHRDVHAEIRFIDKLG